MIILSTPFMVSFQLVIFVQNYILTMHAMPSVDLISNTNYLFSGKETNSLYWQVSFYFLNAQQDYKYKLVARNSSIQCNLTKMVTHMMYSLLHHAISSLRRSIPSQVSVWLLTLFYKYFCCFSPCYSLLVWFSWGVYAI